MCDKLWLWGRQYGKACWVVRRRGGISWTCHSHTGGGIDLCAVACMCLGASIPKWRIFNKENINSCVFQRKYIQQRDRLFIPKQELCQFWIQNRPWNYHDFFCTNCLHEYKHIINILVYLESVWRIFLSRYTVYDIYKCNPKYNAMHILLTLYFICNFHWRYLLPH